MKKLSNITESVWGGMLSRSIGDAERKEDAFNPDYVDFGENTTVYWAIDNLEINGDVKFYFDDVKDFNNNGWRLPTVDEVNQLKWNIRTPWYDGCKHLKFDDGNELRLKTNGSGGFHMWTKEINPKFPTGAFSYGFDNMGNFNISSFNISINKLFVFLVKDKNYVSESVWGGMLSRSTGDTIRKEDDVNFLDRQGLVDYLKTHYKCADDAIIQTIIDGGNIFVCLYKDADGFSTSLMYDHIDGFRKLYLTAGFKDSTYVYNELKTNYKLTEAEGEYINPIDNIRIEPKGCRYKNLTNKFFLEVLDFIIERIDKPLEKQIEKI